eukprot:SAG31_NODE_11525_length_1021_cov_1.241866_1_plen_52_part_00
MAVLPSSQMGRSSLLQLLLLMAALGHCAVVNSATVAKVVTNARGEIQTCSG